MAEHMRVCMRAERWKERAALSQHSLQLHRERAHTHTRMLLTCTHSRKNHRLGYYGSYNFIFAAFANACDVIIKTVITTLK